jgi:hypothetical protein
VAAVALLALSIAPAAHAGFGIASFDGQTTANPNGDPFTRAGGHPHAVSTTFQLNSRLDTHGNLTVDGGGVKDVQVELPPGVVGDPTAITTCQPADFVRDLEAGFGCPASSQIGVIRIVMAIAGIPTPVDAFSLLPIYNLEPPPGVPAMFGFRALSTIAFLDGEVRPSDYGLTIHVRDLSQAITTIGASVTFWGVPTDPVHDGQRFCLGAFNPPCSTDAPLAPFLTTPTSCTPPGGSLVTGLRAASWLEPSVFAEASFANHAPPTFTLPPDPPLPQDQAGPLVTTTGCDRLPFEPSVTVTTDSSKPDSPTGLSIDVRVPPD